MDNSWVTLILLGVAAGFMPMVFGLEIYTLGDNDGAKKVSSLLGGITSFRLLVSLGVVLLFAGVMAGLSQGLSDIGQFIGSFFSQLGQDITSGHHMVIDLLLIASGVLLIFQAIRRVRSSPSPTSGPTSDSTSDSTASPQPTDSSSSEAGSLKNGKTKGVGPKDGDPKEGDPKAGNPKSVDAKALSVGIMGMLGLGLAMSATNVNQWLFTSTAVNQILRMQAGPLTQLFAFLLFLGVATVLIALPLLIFLIRPQAAQGDLKKLDGWINGSMRYIVAGILGLIGLYFIWQGGIGVMSFLATR